MFHLIKLIIWLVGLVVVVNFGLRFFHSRIDWTAVQNSFRACTGVVIPCQDAITSQSLDKARQQCSVSCLSNFSSWIVPEN